ILQVVNIGVQIISTIPEISSIDHNRSQTTDKRIITANTRAEIKMHITLSSAHLKLNISQQFGMYKKGFYGRLT
ncbi:MAG: hypothetical protein OEV45_10305, partial [Desulfobacteraceae bacterium]|nr:hypothetical protein [Desulfobacteraceae bacterium]